MITTGHELIAAFDDIQTYGFYDPVNLTDSIGFSIKKNYPADIRFKPALQQGSRKPDSVAVIWVVYLYERAAQRDDGSLLIPLKIRIGLMSLYRSKHWDYDYSDIEGGCPSKESMEASLASPHPIELSFENDYYYDNTLSALVDKDRNRLSGGEILLQVFEKHCNTVHLLKGLQLRAKLVAQSKFSGVLGLVVSALIFLLKVGFGRTLESSDSLSGLYKPFGRESFKRLDQDSIDLFGYKASKHIIILFCLLVIGACTYRFFHPSTSDYVAWLDGKELVSVAHAIFAIWFIDVVVPWCLFLLVNLTIISKKKVSLMRFDAR